MPTPNKKKSFCKVLYLLNKCSWFGAAGDSWLVKRYYSFGEIFAAIVIIIVLLITAYRLAIIFDWLPEDFKPGEIALHRYQDAKAFLLKEGMQPGAVGSMSRSTLDTFNSIEKYIKKQQEQQKLQEQLPEECRNNSIFKWFMYMSGAENKNNSCTRQNLQMQKALEDANVIKKAPKQKAPTPEPTQAPAEQSSEQQLLELQQQIKQYQPQEPAPATNAQ